MQNSIPKELSDRMDALTDAQLAIAGYVRLSSVAEPPNRAVLPEVVVAAKWWADQLRGTPKMDSGEGFQDAFAEVVRDRVNGPLSFDEIDRFQRWFAYLYDASVKANGWKVNDPNWGSATRAVGVDYGPDPILLASARLAGILDDVSLRFPIKTVMWCNPGSVKVRVGYGGSEVELMKV